MTMLSIKEAKLETQQQYDGVFPLLYVAEDPLAELSSVETWLRDNKGRLLEQLSQHGAILFRGDRKSVV